MAQPDKVFELPEGHFFLVLEGFLGSVIGMTPKMLYITEDKDLRARATRSVPEGMSIDKALAHAEVKVPRRHLRRVWYSSDRGVISFDWDEAGKKRTFHVSCSGEDGKLIFKAMQELLGDDYRHTVGRVSRGQAAVIPSIGLGVALVIGLVLWLIFKGTWPIVVLAILAALMLLWLLAAVVSPEEITALERKR